MTGWFKRKRQARLPGPVPQHIIDAHREALAAQREVAAKAPLLRELRQNMVVRHRRNGFGDKLEAVYQGRGFL